MFSGVSMPLLIPPLKTFHLAWSMTTRDQSVSTYWEDCHLHLLIQMTFSSMISMWTALVYAKCFPHSQTLCPLAFLLCRKRQSLGMRFNSHYISILAHFKNIEAFTIILTTASALHRGHYLLHVVGAEMLQWPLMTEITIHWLPYGTDHHSWSWHHLLVCCFSTTRRDSYTN